MAYTINKTDGSLYATVADGTIDITTSLILVGKNYTGYGEIQNENYFHLLENHAHTIAPGNPQVGQLWFNTDDSVLNVYTGGVLPKSLAVQATSLTEPAAIDSELGDTWYNTTTKQLTVYDGNTYTTVGPLYSTTEGESGAIVTTITDDGAADHVVTQLMSTNQIVAIVSKDASFVPATPITGFGTIKPGITLSSTLAGAQLTGDAANALLLNNQPASDFLSITTNNVTAGTLDIENDTGLTIGLSNDLRLAVTGGVDGLITNDTLNGDINISIPAGSGNINITTAGAATGITIDGGSGNARVGVPNDGLDIVNQSYVSSAISTALTNDIVASDIPLVDTGTYYTTDDVEEAFQEVGAEFAALPTKTENLSNKTIIDPTIALINSLPVYGLVILDTPVQLLDTTSAATVATAIGHATLDSAGATKAIVQLKLTLNTVTVAAGMNLYIKNDNAVVASAIYDKVSVDAAVGDTNAESAQITVNLDVNNDFWYTTFKTGTALLRVRMHLVGYYV